jgi:hypothetical protein
MNEEHRKYEHVERLDHPDVDGLDIGTVYVFPKLDGANASVWMAANGEIKCGSRTQECKGDVTLMGFRGWVDDHADKFRSVLKENPHWRIYGEWLVPHTLKTYREEAWRTFYAFDVFDELAGRYLHYDAYASLLDAAGIKVVEPLCTIKNPSPDQLHNQVQTNTYLIADNAGVGEGIVAKNYEWTNAGGRQPWAKIVRTEFKEQNRRAFGVTEKNGEFQVEAAIAEEFVTPHLVNKTRAKIENALAEDAGISDPEEIRVHMARNRGQVIPRLLQTVYTDLIIEESWHFVKAHKDPVVDFKRLRQFVTAETKKLASDLF